MHTAPRTRWSERFDGLSQDIRFALRTLGKNRGFAAVAILILAIGIGANSAIFSIVNGVLLQPLSLPHPEQLIRAWQNSTTSTSSEPGTISAVNLDDWRARRRVIADLGGYWFGGSGVDLTGLGEPQRLAAAFVTPGFWTTLGVTPLAGRLPRNDEMVRGSNDRLVVLSYAFWQRQFGGTTTVLGRHVTLDGSSYEIVGILPKSFTFPAAHAELFIPFSTIPEGAIPRLRPVRILAVVARMKAGITVAQANAELNAIARGLADEYPENRNVAAASAKPLHDYMVGDVRMSLLILFGAVAFVLLIGAVNLASLLLARATARERELAIRAALGAERGRIVRQLFTESLVLATLGGVLGIGVARVGSQLLLRFAADQIPQSQKIGLDGRVILFTALLSLVTGMIFGLIPAIRASSPALQQSLRSGTRGSTRGNGGVRNVLVVTEVALAMILIVGAGLMTRSFLKLTQVDLGFATDHRIAISYNISMARHRAVEEMQQTYRSILDKVRAVPGVVAAGAIRDLPFQGDGEPFAFYPPGAARGGQAQQVTATLMFASDGFFDAMGIPIVAGRDLSPNDRDDRPLSVVVNQAFAKKYFAHKNAVGQTIAYGDTLNIPIVGVVGDVHQSAVDETPAPRIYVSTYQIFRVKVNLVVRTRENPQMMIERVEDAIHSVEADQTITSAFTLDAAVSDAVARPRLLTLLLGLFGVIGLVLGALGIYGVLAYLVTQRTREIGVRIALGAQRTDLLRMVVGNGLTLAGIGIGVGFAGALGLTRLMSGVLYGVTATDPLTFGFVAVVLLVVAALASLLPALRAVRVDPLVALRAE